ncbi:E3 ubiquitin-protein ligase [Colletotrichum higginsianum]|nr:E3 ubiquitin-protein ligase [Colletotrichum higginsianum]
MAVLPVIRETWESSLIEKLRPDTVAKVIEILKIVSAGDHEPSPRDRPAVELFKKSPVPFNWQAHHILIAQLVEDGADLDLAREAVFRANGNQPSATEYSRLHRAGKAGQRNPVPPKTPTPPGDLSHLVPQLKLRRPYRQLLPTLMQWQSMWHPSSPHRSWIVCLATPTVTSAPAAEDQAQAENRPTNKENLDNERSKLRENLIDRSLDVVRAHPHSAIELSELISAMVFRQQNDDARDEVGATLANALTSLSFDDSDSKSNGTSIADTLTSWLS